MADDQLKKSSATNDDAVYGNKDDEVVPESPSTVHGSKQLEITGDEETLINRMYNLVGERWSLIAGRIPGRSADEIKKYWNSRSESKLSEKQFVNPVQQTMSQQLKSTDIVK